MLKKNELKECSLTGRQYINERKCFPQSMPEEKLITGRMGEEKDLHLLQSPSTVLFLPLEI